MPLYVRLEISADTLNFDLLFDVIAPRETEIGCCKKIGAGNHPYFPYSLFAGTASVLTRSCAGPRCFLFFSLTETELRASKTSCIYFW